MGSSNTKIQLLTAKRDLAQLELDDALGKCSGLFFQRSDGVVVPLGPDAVVITPGSAKVFLGNQPDEGRILRDAEDLACFCNEITADPRWLCVAGAPLAPTPKAVDCPGRATTVFDALVAEAEAALAVKEQAASPHQPGIKAAWACAKSSEQLSHEVEGIRRVGAVGTLDHLALVLLAERSEEAARQARRLAGLMVAHALKAGLS